MIISRKKFNEAIEKAVYEADEKRYWSERLSEVDRRYNIRISELERRINHLEHKTGNEPEVGIKLDMLSK